MKIIDIMRLSAEMIGFGEINKILQTTTEENETEVLQNEEISKMLSLFELSVQELCTNYVSVYVEEEIEVVGNKFPLNQLTNFVRVVSVSYEGKTVKHKIINRNIIMEEDGKYTIKYCTYPTINSLFDEINFLSDFSPEVLVLGLCAYLAISLGMFKEFDVFHQQYIEKAESLKSLNIFELPLRRWE